MKKHHLRESVRSFFGNLVDQDKNQLLNDTKTDFDEKVKKVLTLFENGDLEGNDSGKEAVTGLIKEFHEQYQSLYDQYDHLTGELRKKVQDKGDDDSSSSSSSDSDSDRSSNGKGKRNGRVKKRLTKGTTPETERDNLEGADLKRKLTVLVTEKEALYLEHQTVSSKLKEEEEVIKNLKLEAERLGSEKSELLGENRELHEKLEIAGKIEADLNHRLDGADRLKFELVSEKETAIKRTQEAEKAADDLKSSLLTQIDDKQRMLVEQEAAYNKLSEEYKQAQASLNEQDGTIKKLSEEHEKAQELIEEYRAKLEVSESKVEEMKEEISKNTVSRELLVYDLEESVESLKNELEMKGDEISSLLDKMSNIEVKLRLSNQKLRVTEQTLIEREDIFKKREAKYQEEQRELEDRICVLSGEIISTRKAYQGMIKDVSENVDVTLNEFEMVVQRLGEKYQSYERCIMDASKGVWTATKWITESNVEKARLSEEVREKREQELMLKEKVEELGLEIEKEKKQNVNVKEALKEVKRKIEVLETIVKEREEGMMELGEEKREAIRQLCIRIDYHKNQYDCLKDVLSKMVATRKQIRA